MDRQDFISNEKRKHVVFCAACGLGKSGCKCQGEDNVYGRPLWDGRPAREYVGMAVFNPAGITHTTFSLTPGRLVTEGVTVTANGIPIGTVTQVLPQGQVNLLPVTETDTIVTNVVIDTEASLEAMGYDTAAINEMRQPIGHGTLEELLEAMNMELAPEPPNESL